MSPETILAHAPEPVTIGLEVSDVERVQKLLDAGATLRAQLLTASGERTVEARVKQGDSGEMTGTYNFRVEIDPGVDDGPQRVGVKVELVTADETVRVLGEGVLRLRGDASALQFDGRDAYQLEGLVDPRRVWTQDLDGDGVEDHVVSDVDADGKPLLRVFRCHDGRCESAGEVSVAGADEIFTPDMLAAPSADSGPAGFLAAYVTERSPAGDIVAVEVLHVSLEDDGSGPVVKESRATIDLKEVGADATLHAQAIEPQMLLDAATGTYRPGLVVTRVLPGATGTTWQTVLLDEDGIVSKTGGVRSFAGLADADMEAARKGQLATCLPAGQSGLDPTKAPTGAIVAAFEVDGEPMLAAGPIDPADESMVEISIADFVDPATQQDTFGSVSCRLEDLDGDGADDLVVAVAGKDVYSKLGAAAGKPATLFVGHGILQGRRQARPRRAGADRRRRRRR